MLDTIMLIVGYCGAAAFAFCSAPQVIKAYRTKSTGDISIFFIILSIIGNLCSAGYIFYTNYISGMWQYPQYFNYSFATILIFLLLGLKLCYDSGLAGKRKSIDSIDDKIRELLKKRMEIASEIGKEKKKFGLPINDPKRELDILCKIPLNEPYRDNIESIYYKIIEETRKIEKEDE